MTDPMSDHLPYLMCLDIACIRTCVRTNKTPKLIKKRVNNKITMNNMLDELTATDISQHFINDVTQDPNHNYDKLHDHVKALRDKYMQLRYEKIHKHRHKRNQWMIYGTLRSIKKRDEMYITYKKIPQNSAEYYILKNNIRVLNSILKRAIREAKINYYNEVFEI